MLFTQSKLNQAKAELRVLIDDAATMLYTDTKASDIKSIITAELSRTRLEQSKVLSKIPETKRFNAAMSNDKVVEHIQLNFPKGERSDAYLYADLTRRIALLTQLLNSKVKLRKVALDTLRNAIRAELQQRNGSGVTLGQIIDGCPLKVISISTDTILGKFQLAEVRLQFISELLEEDLLDMRVSSHTHMIDIPSKLASKVDIETWEYMRELTMIAGRKTIFTEVPRLDETDLITRSSWYYRTPELSSDQREFAQSMHMLKYQFVDNASELIEDAYLEHLRDEEGNLPEGWDKWVPQRIRFLKVQIAESKRNGGHYVSGKFDSALRWYMQSEIGHFQTSPSLRHLVKVADITNPIKKDFRNNVVQMYSLLMKERTLAKYVGLVPEEDRLDDLRLTIARTLNTRLEVDVFNKDNIKPLFMVWAYNAGKARILDGVEKVEGQLFGPDLVNTKVRGLMSLTGAKNDETNRDIIWSAFEQTVLELVPSIVVLKAVFKRLIKHNPLNEVSWTLPDGAIAQYASAQTHEKMLNWVDRAGHKRQHTHHIKAITENVKSAGLLPRVIHSFDAYVARQLVIRAARLGIAVVPNHDSFMFDTQYESIIGTLVQDLFTELLESDHFGSVVTELNTAGKSLAVKDENGNYITDSVIWDKYGKLSLDDLKASEPMDLEEI